MATKVLRRFEPLGIVDFEHTAAAAFVRRTQQHDAVQRPIRRAPPVVLGWRAGVEQARYVVVRESTHWVPSLHVI